MMAWRPDMTFCQVLKHSQTTDTFLYMFLNNLKKIKKMFCDT